MSILKALSSKISGHINEALGQKAVARSNLVTTRKSHREQATAFSEYDSGRVPHYVVNEKSLERNKYAPWGRGTNSGLPIENKACQDTRVNKKVINSFN